MTGSELWSWALFGLFCAGALAVIVVAVVVAFALEQLGLCGEDE